jgi:ATP-binding cassette, subfamily F, member 3
MISVSNIEKTYPGKILFENLSFTMSKGERLGLVGRNGCGKSTLLKIIIGEIQADSGKVVLPKGYRLGYLSQHLEFNKATVLEECCEGLEIYEHYKAERILQGLGFTDEGMHKSPLSFSGGYQLRINLAKCILQEPDLLILDEPTNYLDLLSLRWLKDYLLSYPGEVILITHDQYFMDQVITHTLGIYQTEAKKIKGPSQKYYDQVKLEYEILVKSKANQDQKIKEMEKFVERFRAKASKAAQAQSKMKAIEKIEVIELKDAENSLGFKFSYLPTPAKRLLKAENLSFGYNPGEYLYENLSFELTPESRIAIVGQNGKGKTTLLRQLAQELTNNKDEVWLHPQTKIGFYHQTNKKDLNLKATVADEIAETNPLLTITQVRGICGAMMFTGDDALKKIGVLSGGEQARVLLGKILAYPNNCLLLDEPSNHLDRDAVERLGDEVGQFPGPVVFVTHHEGLLHKLATHLIYFKEVEGQPKAHFFAGTYQDFLDKVGWGEDTLTSKKKTNYSSSNSSSVNTESMEEIGSSSNPAFVEPEVTKPKRSAAEHQEHRKKMNRLKKSIENLESEILKMEEDLELQNKKLEQIMMSDDSNKNTMITDHYKSVGLLQKNLQQKYLELEPLIIEVEKD